jgi:hypothetical protein
MYLLDDSKIEVLMFANMSEAYPGHRQDWNIALAAKISTLNASHA